ncbi:carbonic anhydrase family protein [Solirubrobacter ginsenosidimutans]|uniref:Carbonic anhydrase family protein n=1 Tax=Solirubrobacter ginsenosidimutans TaxID=490573 RepID=A0A9X3N363_9ACTN|nr:carbonic anhydrase family protein [Solirubrobacter ginsenosidimutans]MDA0167397.1 carbonic anhydrase family protein [Solirubrobacter ginsenosidimutans]
MVSACLAALLATLAVVTALAGAAPASSSVDPGSAQSPIDLRRSQITFVNHLPAIRFSYPRKADVTLNNTGSPGEESTVRAEVPAGAASITLSGTRYTLQQFHWHTPSEHEINGHRSAMEMHLVHGASDGSLLVIGVLIEQGRANRVLEPIFADLPAAAGETRPVAGVRIDDLLPDDVSSYRYTGSLTTPPFTEGVQWIVLAHPITLSKHQIHAFQALFEEGNSREVQPLNGRKVLSDAGRHNHGDRD